MQQDHRCAAQMSGDGARRAQNAGAHGRADDDGEAECDTEDAKKRQGLPATSQWWVHDIHVRHPSDACDERPSVLRADPSDSRQRVNKRLSHLVGREIRGAQEEGTDTTGQDCFAFERAALEILVFGHHPSTLPVL